jgi:hypothetical protein
MRMSPGALSALVSLASLTFGCDRGDASRQQAPIPASSASAATPQPAPASSALGPAASIHCASDPTFPPILDVPEASAAAEVELRPGHRELLVVSDSDRSGAALAYALPDGPARKLTLPLDRNVTDDVEGLAWRAGHLYALVSTGYAERFTPDGSGALVRDHDAYPLGAPPFSSPRLKYPWGQPPDFEGLCLRPPPRASTLPSPPPPRCAGYAASRAYGWLVCLVFDDAGRLRVEPTRPRLPLDVKKQSLSDCAFGAAGGPGENALLVTTNIRGGSSVYRVDEETGALAVIDVDGTLNNEAIAIDRDGRLYQLMDANADTSPGLRATCTGW